MSDAPPLRAGTAKTNITPPVGVDLTGYGGRPSGCTSIHDDLYARALVLENDGMALALVSLDVIGIDWDLRDEIRARVQDATGIAPKALLLNSSHTHAGPATETFRGLGLRDESYVRQFVDRVVAVVRDAHARVVPARIGFGRTPVQVGINRRQPSGGRLLLADYPQGVVVPRADVIRIETTDGHLLATWFEHACHPVTMGGENLAVSAEFCGVAAELIEAVCGGIALFAQGCCGDINPKRRGTWREVTKNGRILAGAVIRAVEEIDAAIDRPVLNAVMEEVPLAVQPPTPLAEIDAQLESFKAQVEEAKKTGMNRGQVWLREAWRDWATDMRNYSLDPAASPKHIDFEVQALRIGDLAVVGLPGEVFAEYELSIDADSPFAQTTVLGYTNGCHGYVPTESAYPLGGYEVSDAIRYYGTLMFAPECDAQLRAGANRLLNALAG